MSNRIHIYKKTIDKLGVKQVKVWLNSSRGILFYYNFSCVYLQFKFDLVRGVLPPVNIYPHQGVYPE